MKIDQIKLYIENYKKDKKNIFTTSSFQTHSIVLLHILSKIDNTIPVYSINTGFLFPETIEYKKIVGKEFGLNIIDTEPLVPKSQQKDSNGNFLYTCDPDYCCFINKVAPMDDILKNHDIWVNGVRADQSAVRKQMKIEQPAKNNVLRFHPMLDWSNKEIFDYIKKYDLPRHPLDKLGYSSIGCEPCTRKPDLNNMGRAGRWFGMKKTECGLNTDLVK